MMGLKELKADRELVNEIDWEMTPEIAVETFLEWGTGWSRKDTSVRYTGQDSIYFVIYDWDEPPQVTLLRRDMKDAVEITKIEAPPDLIRQSIVDAGRKPGVGVYALNAALKEWLRRELGA